MTEEGHQVIIGSRLLMRGLGAVGSVHADDCPGGYRSAGRCLALNRLEKETGLCTPGATDSTMLMSTAAASATAQSQAKAAACAALERRTWNCLRKNNCDSLVAPRQQVERAIPSANTLNIVQAAPRESLVLGQLLDARLTSLTLEWLDVVDLLSAGCVSRAFHVLCNGKSC